MKDAISQLKPQAVVQAAPPSGKCGGVAASAEEAVKCWPVKPPADEAQMARTGRAILCQEIFPGGPFECHELKPVKKVQGQVKHIEDAFAQPVKPPACSPDKPANRMISDSQAVPAAQANRQLINEFRQQQSPFDLGADNELVSVGIPVQP